MSLALESSGKRLAQVNALMLVAYFRLSTVGLTLIVVSVFLKIGLPVEMLEILALKLPDVLQPTLPRF